MFSKSNLFVALLKGFWIIIPAYVSNASAPLANGKHRMDLGKKFLGNELFGRGKTWEGFFFAIFSGVLAGATELLFFSELNRYALKYGFKLPELNIILIFLIPTGAMLGDLFGSFIKRRFDMKSGCSVPILDQLDFVLSAFFFASFFLWIPVLSIYLIILITPILHLISSFIGFKLSLKKVPW